MSQYIQLSNSAIFRLDRIAAVIRKGINDYAIIIDELPIMIDADGADIDVIMKHLPDIIKVEKPVVTIQTKLEKIDD